MKQKKESIFQQPVPLRNGKTHEIVSGVLVFVILPIFSCLITLVGEESALYNSLSRLAWPEGYLWLIYLWGILNIGCFAYVLELLVRAGGYTTRYHKLFVAMEIAAALVMTAGVSIPAYHDRGQYYLTLQTIHTAISAVGFVGFYLVLLAITGTLFFRWPRQAMVSALGNAFILIVGIYGIFTVTDPNSYCHISSIMQVLLFDLFNVSLLLHYYAISIFHAGAQSASEKSD